MRRFLFILVCGIGLFTACWEWPDETSDPLTFADMMGTYRINYGHARLDEVVLRPDSVCVHTYISATGERFADSSSFEIVDQGRHTYRLVVPKFVIFAPVRDRCDQEVSRNPTEIDTIRLVARIWRSRGRQMIDRCPNEYKGYVKVK